MANPVLIGDRLTAAGFRLAGVRTIVVDAEQVVPAFREALSRDEPVMITAALARNLPAALLESAVSRASPPVAVIPDINRSVEPDDMAKKIRRALGVEA